MCHTATSEADWLARWHRFVSIERPESRQTLPQGILARAMISRRNSALPLTAVRARPGLSCNSSGSAIAILRAPRAYRFARCLQEARRPAAHSPQSPSRTFREIHLEPGSPFYAGTRHTPGPGDIKLCSPAPFR